MKATARAAQKLTSARLYQEGFVSRKEKEAEDSKEKGVRALSATERAEMGLCVVGIQSKDVSLYKGHGNPRF